MHTHLRPIAVALALLATAALRAAEGDVVVREAEDWGVEQKLLCLDPSASGEKAALLNFSKGGGDVHGSVELPGGVYAVTFYITVKPAEYMHSLAIGVRAGSERRTLNPAWFEKSLVYRPVLLYVNHAGGDLRFSFGGKATTGFNGMRRTSSDDEKAAFKSLENTMGEDKKAPKEGDDTGGLEDLEGFPKITSLHPADLVAAWDKVECRKLADLPACVAMIDVDKVHYKPGEEVKCGLEAAAAKPGKYAITVFEIREADTARPVFEKETELAAASQKFEFSYKLDTTEFGRQLLATVRPAGTPAPAVTLKALATPRVSFPGSADAFFGVSANVYRIGISANPGGQSTQGLALEQARKIMAENKRAYANYYERFAWAPCDYSCLAPDTELFWSGQTQYPGSITGLRNLINAGHEVGVKAITYGKSCAGGIYGFKTFQKHPEFFTTYNWGIGTEGLGVFLLERMLNNEYKLYEKPEDGGWQDWQSLWCEWQKNDETVDFGADAIIDGVKMFGWDGVRWDGHFTGKMARFKARMNAAVPGFVHGYNIAFGNPGSKMFLPSEPVADFHECAKDHGLMMDESIREYSHTNYSYGVPAVFYEAICREGDYMKRIGGLPLYIMFDMASQLDSVYNVMMGLAAGQRYTYATTAGDFPAGPLTRWLTRYSAYVWDNTKLIKKPETLLKVEYAPPAGMKEDKFPLLWKESCWVRDVAPNRKQILVNFVNPPRYPAFADRSQPPALARQDVRVALPVPNGAEVTSVLHLSIDLPTGMDVLEPKTADGFCVVTVPRIAVWSIVAFELKAQGETFAAEPFPLTTPVEDAATFMKEEAGKKQAKKATEDAAKAAIKQSDPEAKARDGRWTDFTAKRNFDADDEKKPETAKQLKALLAKPDTIPGMNRNGVLDVHHARGLYSWLNPVQAAVGIVGGGRFTVSWQDLHYVSKGGNPPRALDEFPDSFARLFEQDVLVLDNLNAEHLGILRRCMIKDYVANGGGLLIFGGYFNLSCGLDVSTWMEELMPVSMAGFQQLAKDNAKGYALAPADRGFFAKTIDWGRSPACFYIDTSPVKPNAKVLVTAGDKPAIVAGSYGKGRVIVVLMNPHGNPPQGQLPYWEWRDWPNVIASCVQWLSNGYTEKNSWEKAGKTVKEGTMTPADLSVDGADMAGPKFTAALKEACQNVVDAESALTLLECFVEYRDKISDPAVMDLVTKTVVPFPNDAFLPLGIKLMENDLPEYKIAAARILALSKKAEALPPLKQALGNEDQLVRREAILALGAINSPQAVDLLQTVAKKDKDNRFIAMTLLAAQAIPGALQDALPLYVRQMQKIRDLKSGHFSMHDNLYGGVSFKLTPESRRAMEKQHARLERIERAAREDGIRFDLLLPQLKPAQIPEAIAFFAATEERDSVGPAYTVLGRLPDAERQQYAAQLKAAKLKDIRIIVE